MQVNSIAARAGMKPAVCFCDYYTTCQAGGRVLRWRTAKQLAPCRQIRNTGCQGQEGPCSWFWLKTERGGRGAVSDATGLAWFPFAHFLIFYWVIDNSSVATWFFFYVSLQSNFKWKNSKIMFLEKIYFMWTNAVWRSNWKKKYGMPKIIIFKKFEQLRLWIINHLN